MHIFTTVDTSNLKNNYLQEAAIFYEAYRKLARKEAPYLSLTGNSPQLLESGLNVRYFREISFNILLLSTQWSGFIPSGIQTEILNELFTWPMCTTRPIIRSPLEHRSH
jgi:hypothetical protein